MTQHKIIKRKAWGFDGWLGGRPPAGGTVPVAERTEFYVHYEGGRPCGDQTGPSVPRAIHDFHKNGRGWAGIGYSWVVDQAGHIYEGRGWGYQEAHCPGHNRSAWSVQGHIGGDEQPSDAMLSAIRWLYDQCCRRAGRALAKRGHRDGFATECPGDPLYRWVEQGMPAPAGGTGGAGGAGGGKPKPEPKPEPADEWDGHSFPGRDRFQLGDRGPWVTVLGERLVAHGFGGHYSSGPGPRFTAADRACCRSFQLAQGWTGRGADGFPGPETWRRLMAEPAYPFPSSGEVYLDKLQPGATDSDSVYYWRLALNALSLPKGRELAMTGDYTADVQRETVKFQRAICRDPGDGWPGPKQAQLGFGRAKAEMRRAGVAHLTIYRDSTAGGVVAKVW